MNVPVIRTKNKRLEEMLLTNNCSNTKPNKYYDVDNTKRAELVDLLQDFLSVNLFEIGYDRKIKNVILQQIENKDSIIVIKIAEFPFTSAIFEEGSPVIKFN